MNYQHPRDLPPEWRERWEERAAIIQEGCRLPTDREGTAEANRRAFADVLRCMAREVPSPPLNCRD